MHGFGLTIRVNSSVSYVTKITISHWLLDPNIFQGLGHTIGLINWLSQVWHWPGQLSWGRVWEKWGRGVYTLIYYDYQNFTFADNNFTFKNLVFVYKNLIFFTFANNNFTLKKILIGNKNLIIWNNKNHNLCHLT